MAHSFNLSTQGAEAKWISLNSRQAWSTQQVLGQPGLHSETLSQAKLNKQTKIQRGWHLRLTSGLHMHAYMCICRLHVGTRSHTQRGRSGEQRKKTGGCQVRVALLWDWSLSPEPGSSSQGRATQSPCGQWSPLFLGAITAERESGYRGMGIRDRSRLQPDPHAHPSPWQTLEQQGASLSQEGWSPASLT